MSAPSNNITKIVEKYFKEKGLPLTPALAFIDAVIEDRFSTIESRSDIRDLRTRLAGDIFLNIPIVSANMDTVTNAKMAIALARLGGLGFLHQFFSLEERLAEIEKVKRADNIIIENPVTVLPSATLRDAKILINRYQVSSVLVVNEQKKLLGILSFRDYRFRDDDNCRVTELMTAMPLITASPSVSRQAAERIFSKHKVEKLPLIDKENRLIGLMSAKDILKEKMFPMAARDKKGKLLVGAAVRLNADYLKEAEILARGGADTLLLDTARANSSRVVEAVKKIKKKIVTAPLVVGNIDTPAAALTLIKAGADCLKVGIGPGSACKTREATGVGVPQLAAVAACAAVAKKFDIPLIADGGVKSGADLSKALVAGANAVMLGSLLAGTDESPGEVFQEANQRWKMYRGSASAEHQFARIEGGSLDDLRSPEGVPRRVLYSGPVRGVVEELLAGLRSSMSYVGARDLKEFWRLGKFVWQSRSGYEEGKPLL